MESNARASLEVDNAIDVDERKGFPGIAEVGSVCVDVVVCSAVGEVSVAGDCRYVVGGRVEACEVGGWSGMGGGGV
eukprot:776183-Pyramimonas_sp.AAC.1